MEVIVPLLIILAIIVSFGTRRSRAIPHRPYANPYTDAPGSLDR